MDNAGLKTRCRYIYNTYEGVNPCWKIWWGMKSHHVCMSNTFLKPKVEPWSWHFVTLLKLTFVKVVYFYSLFPYQGSAVTSMFFIKAVYPSLALLKYHALRELLSTGTICLTVYWSFLSTSIFENGFTEHWKGCYQLFLPFFLDSSSVLISG